LDHLQEEGIPTVLVDILISDEAAGLTTVNIDYATGARLAIEHLNQLGHTAIGYLGFSGSEKYRGYWESLERLGLRYDPRHVEFLQLLDLQPGILAGYQAMQRMIARQRLPSALLITNDLVALGVMEALAVTGIRTPEQISIVGFDDLGQKTSPPLTTVRVDLNLVGRLAAETLFRKIAGDVIEPELTLVPVELVVRGTTAAASITEAVAEIR
jgi:DNA-binding LacI/PurR family transcriptional regulator